MAELILDWINSLHLSKKVTSIEKDFSNGFLLGELLAKLKQLESLSDFVWANTPAACVNNFTLLEPVLRRLDIRLDTNKMQLIIEEQEGAALQLVYQIKVAISKHSKNCGRTLSDISRVVGTEKPIYEAAQQKFVAERLKKLVWPTKTGLAKNRSKSPPKRDRSRENDKSDVIVTRQQQTYTGSPPPVGRENSRGKPQGKPKKDAEAPDADNASGKATPSKTLRSFQSTKGRAGSDCLAKSAPLTKAKNVARVSEEEVRDGIAHFEANLQRLGLDAASSSAVSLSSTGGKISTERPQHLEIELSKRLPSPSACHRENAKMMERLHGARAAQELARKEREKRRQKLLMEQNQARAASAASAVIEALVGRAQHRSNRAAAVEYQLWKVKQYQRVIEENRACRDAQYAQKQHLHEEMSKQRKFHVESVARDSLHREVHLEAAQCRSMKKQLRAARRTRLIEESFCTLDLILDLVAAASFHTQQHDTVAVDSRTWREWLIAFIEGKSPLLTAYGHSGDGAVSGTHPVAENPDFFFRLSGPSIADSMLHGLSSAEESVPALCSVNIENRLSEDEFFLYLNSEGQWHVRTNAENAVCSENVAQEWLRGVAPAEIFQELIKASETSYPGATERLKADVPTNPNGEPAVQYLGKLVNSLFELHYFDPPLPRPAAIPDCPLRIIITGKPFTGKRILAKKLGEKFKLHVIDFAGLLKDVLALQHDSNSSAGESEESVAAESASPLSPLVTSDHPPQSSDTCMLMLAKKARAVLEEGKKLSNHLCVDLCVAKIEELFVAGSLNNVKELLLHVPVREPPESPIPHKNDKSGALSARKCQKIGGNVKDKNQAFKEVVDETAQQKIGWILVDFPQTYEQCVMLEERLSGFVTPDRLPGSEVARKKAKASFVIPIPTQPHVSQSLIEGGVDVHFILDISTEDVLLKARGVGAPEKRHESGTMEAKSADRILQPVTPAECLRPHATLSVADECCYIEEEQKVAQLFLRLFGVRDQPRLQILSAKSDTEVLTAAAEIVEKVVARKRQDLARETAIGSRTSINAERDHVSELLDTAWKEKDHSDQSTLISAGAESSVSTKEVEQLRSGSCRIPLPPPTIECLEDAVKKYLLDKWDMLEEEYVITMMKVFAWIRQTHREFARGIIDLQMHFTDLLQRPDSKQEIVDVFFAEYNAFISSIPRSLHLDSIKEEMHLQVDELAESLWQQIDARRTQAKAEHKRLAETGWLEAVCQVLAAQLQALVEAEIKRYLALEEFATDAYYSLLRACIPERKRTTVNSSALHNAAQSAAKQAYFWFCKQRPLMHDDAAHKPWQLHIFELEAKAKEHLIPLTEFENYAPSTVELDKKKPNRSKVTVKEEIKPKMEPPLHVELQQTRLELQVQLFCRLRRLCLWGAARLTFATKVGNEALGQMDDWIVARSLAEHAAVRELTTRIKYCIENERNIPHAMTLSGTQLVLDPNALLGELNNEESSLCQLPPPPKSSFTIAMLRSLMSDIELVASGGVISVEALREIIMRRVTHSKCFRTQDLPQNWLDTPASKLSHISDYFEIAGGFVDVIEFLLSLAFGNTGWPSNKQLHEICCAVRSASSDAAVAKLGSRSGAAPLEFFITRAEFATIDFGDWLADCSRQEMNSQKKLGGLPSGGFPTAREGISGKGALPEKRHPVQQHQEDSFVSFLFDLFLSFQSPVRRCQEEVSALQALGIWTETNPSTANGSIPTVAEKTTDGLTATHQVAFEQRGFHEVYARKLLGYLALGAIPGEGLQRLLAVSVERSVFDTVPTLLQDDFLSAYDLYITCMGVGVRPPCQAIPPAAKLSFSSFCKTLSDDGKRLEHSSSLQGISTPFQHVNVLEFLNSPTCTQALMYSGSYFRRRTISSFCEVGLEGR